MTRALAQQESFLYVGRSAATAHYLHQALNHLLSEEALQRADAPPVEESLKGAHPYSAAANPAAGNGAVPAQAFPLELMSNQKAALRFVQHHATRLIAVETSDKATSRKRFCESVRQRAPSACIVAVGLHTPGYTFAFDAVISTPLRHDDLLRLAHRLRARAPESVIRRGTVTLDTVTREVISPRGAGKMTPKECALLTLLMRRANQVVGRAEIMRTIWETNFMDDTRTLDVHVRWVRQKIEPDPEQPRLLLTRRGEGYLFVADDL